MSTPIAFESIRVKEAKREEKRKARAEYLEQVKKQYEKEEYKKEQAKLRGENTWMLPSLSDKIDREQKEMENMKAKKKKKDKKKKKKHKKEKKKKKKESDSDSSDDDSDQEDGWVEKMASSGSGSSKTENTTEPAIKGPKLERDGWMMESTFDLMPLTSRQEIQDKHKNEKDKEKETNLLDQPGIHERELNPYWKDGGTGLPEEKPVSKKEGKESADKVHTGVLSGDGGLSWLKKSYERCVQQAEEEGRSLEDIAAERFGSLKKLKSMLTEAEKANKKIRDSKYSERSYKSSYRDNDSNVTTTNTKKFMKPGDDSAAGDSGSSNSRSRSNYKNGDSSSRTSDRNSNDAFKYRRSRSRSRDRSKHRSRYSRSRSRSKSRDYSKRDRSKERSRHSRSRSRDKSYRDFRKDSRRSRSGSRERSSDRRDRNSDSRFDSSRKLSSRFMKPGEMDSVESNEKHSSSNSSNEKRNSKDYVPSWKKKEYLKPKVEESTKECIKDKKINSPKFSEKVGKRRHSPSSSSSSSESSSSSDSEPESKNEEEKSTQKPVVQEVKILSEKEMNELGAKILRAELMGDDELATELKSQLELSRKAVEENKSQPPASVSAGPSQTKDKDDNVAVLTRTDRSGMVRPLPENQYDKQKQHGRKKKQKAGLTHDKGGERERYFDDDDKYSLKNLVEREKMGTAEDQNKMFARLAGRAFEKGDDDFQVDDIFVSRASKKQSEAQAEEKDRSAAIYEHKKMAKALETCQFCFENVPKHLIIAIGMKVYLCLPNHRSLTEGHCLIVPMQHVASSTAVDEDVWTEVQVFRKGLTKMFEDRDEDVVFMETSMKLKYFPHMHIECIPMEKETGDLAPIYFKKAIQESESEWSDNKKLVDLSQKNIRRSVPKGFPYFSVDFGLQGGFAHVIEDEHKFPSYFGREIVGGMIDAEARLWRKPQKENFEDQRKKVLQFSEWWKPYDWTNKLDKEDT